MDLNALFLRLKNGEKRVLEEIYSATKRAVFSVAYAVLKDSSLCEDVMQDTYCRLCDNIQNYSGGNPLTWLCHIAKNIAIDYYRKQKNYVSFDDSLVKSGQTENGISDLKHETLDILKIAARCLNGTEYTVLFLHTIGDLGHKEIAEILHKPYATVRWNYSQAIKKMQIATRDYGV
jgi:RNA polymerase sigma-70 factor (ECF subfamily)